MKRNDFKKLIRDRKTEKPDESVFNRILSQIEESEAHQPSTEIKKTLRLKPVAILAFSLLLVFSSLAVTAAVNSDIRAYLVSLFGGNPNSVEGEIIGKIAEMDGVQLKVEAVVPEGDSLFMVYTLIEAEEKMMQNGVSLDAFSVSINGDSNYSAAYNSIIKNREMNYMTLQTKASHKGVQMVQFSVKSLKVPDPSKETALSVGTASYRAEGIDGAVVDKVKMVDNRIQVEISISDENQYRISNNLYVKNTKTGKIFYQKAQEETSGSDGKRDWLRWYSDELDGGKPEDYVFCISFDRIYVFSSPLSVDFDVDFSREPIKVIKPQQIYIQGAKVEKVTVNQMSIIADVYQRPENTEALPVKPVKQQSTYDTLFSDPDPNAITSQHMVVRYQDHEEAELISGSISRIDEGRYRFRIILNGTLDFERKPVLYIGETGIPLS